MSGRELAKRRAALPPLPDGAGKRGYEKLYLETVTQAGQGCDFDFCIPEITRTIP